MFVRHIRKRRGIHSISCGASGAQLPSMICQRGLIIHTRTFPGWDSFSAMHSHLAFVREHHKKIPRIAFVTDSVLRNLAETIGKHFVSAGIKSFQNQDLDRAKAWLLGA